MQMPKPITFMIDDVGDQEDTLKENVKFIIEGGGKAIQTNFVRKNEQEFFEFITGFTRYIVH